jgi:predicted Rossmann fold nucleotide-binding protein DprA/Smf involved in DNA uptake
MEKKSREILLTLAFKNKNEWTAIYSDIKNKYLITDSEYTTAVNSVNHDYLCIIDEDYPECLKEIPMPPFIILLHEDDQNVFGDRFSANYIKLMRLLETNKGGF